MRLHVSKRLGVVIGVVVGVLVIAVFVAASIRSVSQTRWTLMELSPDGRSLVIEVKLGGSSCVALDRTAVSETSNEVRIEVYASRKALDPRALCTADAQVHHLDFQLDEPLGDRPLTGCLQSRNCLDTREGEPGSSPAPPG